MQPGSSPSRTETISASVKESSDLSWRWRLADIGIFAIWLALVAVIVSRHEKWADEAQAWLLARDLPFFTLWLKELRYEGCPGLWHSILWVAQHAFHIPYSGIGVIGMLCAALGVALILWFAPFPRPLRWLLAFSYFVAYQYAVIARPYVLIPLLLFAAALFFKDVSHPERMAVALALLTNVSAHGALMSACIGLAYIAQVVPLWRGLDRRVQRNYLLSVLAMVAVFVEVFLVLKPPHDVEAINLIRVVNTPTVLPRTWKGVNGAFFDSTPLTLVWLALLAAWCGLRRGMGSLLLVVMVMVMAFFYGFYGLAHHQGTIFLPAIAGLWITWPTANELNAYSAPQVKFYRVFVLGLACLLSYQALTSAVTMWNDYLYAYCGAADTAAYLRSEDAVHQRIMGFGYAMVGVEAYFDGHLLTNRPTSYFHHGDPFWGMRFEPKEIQRESPEFVVLPTWFEPDAVLQKSYEPWMQALGYSLVHISPGHAYSKQGFDTWQYYYIYRHNH